MARPGTSSSVPRPRQPASTGPPPPDPMPPTLPPPAPGSDGGCTPCRRTPAAPPLLPPRSPPRAGDLAQAGAREARRPVTSDGDATGPFSSSGSTTSAAASTSTIGDTAARASACADRPGASPSGPRGGVTAIGAGTPPPPDDTPLAWFIASPDACAFTGGG